MDPATTTTALPHVTPRLGHRTLGGAIIFIDELDAIGTKRFGGEQSGDREVQRTMLELLSQLDGFSSNDNIKVRSTPFTAETPRSLTPPCFSDSHTRTASTSRFSAESR